MKMLNTDESAHPVPTYTILFPPLYHFPSVTDTPAMWHTCATSCVTPMSHCDRSLAPLTLVALLIYHTIRLALCMEHTGDLWTSLLCFPFWTGPHAIFLITISFSNLLICHHDMRQFHPVSRLALMQANQSQVIAPCSQWVRGLLPFHHKWSLFSFFLDKSFCI